MTLKNIALLLIVLLVIGQALASALFVIATGFELIEQGDTIEYVTIADNILAGRGYSSETVEPWRPTSSRGPGTLLVNIPLRSLFSSSDDALAVSFSKITLLITVALLCLIAIYFEPSPRAYLAGIAFLIMPSVGYYSVNPYASSPTFLLGSAILFLSMIRVMESKRFGVILVLIGSIYLMSSRTAAMFPLTALIGMSVILSFMLNEKEIRWKLRYIAVAVLVGSVSVYLPWSYRNLEVFGSFQYTSIQGFNLLHKVAAGMQPYLDKAALAEIDAVREANPTKLHQYHGEDQMELAAIQGKEGIRLIMKYPEAFVISQVVGVLESFFIFRPSILEGRMGTPGIVLASIYQAIFTFTAIIGLIRPIREMSPAQRAILMLFVAAGIGSLLAGGSFGQPRFRFPLEFVTAIGCMYFARDFLLPRFRRYMDARDKSQKSRAT